MSIPSNINTDITKISNAKTLIRNAINAKGVSVSVDDTFASYAQKIGQLNAPDGYKVIVVDYDGEIITQVTKQAGETFTLPEGPTNHSKLVFQEWSSCDEITNNTVTVTDHDILVGAVYTTASGTNEFDIELTEATGKKVTFKMTGNKNWGDGTSDTANSHTYADYGEYTITCDGTTLNQSYIMGQSSNYDSANFTLKHVRLATVTSISSSVFYWCTNLETITLSKSLTSIGTSVFQAAINLRCCIFPSTVASVSFNNMFQSGYKLKYAVIPNIINLNLQNTFYDCENLEFPIFPSNCISFYQTYYQCYSIKDVYVPLLNNDCNFSGTFQKCSFKNIVISADVCNHITNLQATFQGSAVESVVFLGSLSNCTTIQNLFAQCTALESVSIPNLSETPATTVSDGTFSTCPLQSVQLPTNLKHIGNQMFYTTPSIDTINFPDVQSFGNSVFYSCYNLRYINFLQNTAVPTITSTTFNTSANYGMNKGLIIHVPRNLYQDWIRANVWTGLKKYIYGGEPATLNFNITPSTAKTYVYDEQYEFTGSTPSCSFVGTLAPYIVYDVTLNTVAVGEINNIAENYTYSTTINLNNTSKTITWQAGVSNCIITVDIRGVKFVVPESNTPGTYVLNIIGDSATINYTIQHQLLSELTPVTGTINYQNNNVTESVTVNVSDKKYHAPMVPLTGADTTTLYIHNAVNNTPAELYKWFDGDITTNCSLSYSYLNDRYNGNVDSGSYKYGVVRKYSSPVCINKVTYYPYTTNYSNNPYVLYLSASNDGSTWTQLSSFRIKTGATNDLSNTNPKTFEFDNMTKYSYYRFGTDYSNGEYYGNPNIKEIDCPTFETTTWNTSYNRSITVTHNVNNAEIVEAYITNNSGYRFNLYHWDNQLKGTINTEGNDSVTLYVKVKGYATYTETFTASSDVTKSINLAPQTLNIEMAPNIGDYNWKVSEYTNPKANDGWLMYQSDNGTDYIKYSVMKVTISGYNSFTVYINSYAYSSYNYSYATILDPADYSGATANIQGQSTSSFQQLPTIFSSSNYRTITYDNIPSGEHFFYIVFIKSRGNNNGYNAGFCLIDPNQ